ncbi:type II toxin-antitoxin system VapC family toxin [Desulfofundulus thermocisternus]|uniref:type II toxin-antitoxin system VapC family toxin n=1 Tax=Desulfofundulus thermocisternus TaxID=42471 RepID=UPI0019D98BB8|nr:PIN domain-containing protein [Desulfofundulus thermocisternus]MBE3586841.1 type II toxin-antitoxin system VapC family toxin [Thermoanaerobacter sp.]MCS5695470.1 PIN domain-containing protein [Desulfofundulus thermocisternus]
MTLLVDSSAVLALLNNRDQWHQTAITVLHHLVANNSALVMTNFLVAETHTLLLTRLGHDIAREWLLTFDWNVVRVSPEDEQTAREIIKKYRDKDFSFTDATSFAVMYRYGINLAFTFDRHFKQYGFQTVGI